MNDFTMKNEEEKKEFLAYQRNKRIQAIKTKISKFEYNAISPTAIKSLLQSKCKEVERLSLGGIVVLPNQVRACANYFSGEEHPAIIASISYPYGADSVDVKSKAIKRALRDGASEVEVTVPINYIKEGNFGMVKRELKKIRSAGKKGIVRLNIEAALLSEQEIQKLCAIVCDCKITVICLTTTMFGAIDGECVQKVRQIVKDRCLIKIYTNSQPTEAVALLELGFDLVATPNATEVANYLLSQEK